LGGKHLQSTIYKKVYRGVYYQTARPPGA